MRKNTQFTALAEYYDALNGADYGKYADYVEQAVKKYGRGFEESPVLDLGCGTGSLTLELSRRGYDMIGADISYDMLNVAMQRSAGERILYLRQDMRAFELYGSVKAVVCALDGINYLPSLADVRKCFSLVNNYLDPGGVFLFDVNTPWRFENAYRSRDIFTQDGSGAVYMGWHSEYSPEDCACDFDITLFIRDAEDGAYIKKSEHQREYSYTKEQLVSAINEAGMELIAVFSDTDISKPATFATGEEKWYFVAGRPIAPQAN